MPLKKSASPRAFKSNVKEMVHSGHPVKQALAAAYATKRSAMKKKKNMAGGGYAESDADSAMGRYAGGGEVNDMRSLHTDPANQNYKLEVGDGGADPQRYRTESSEEDSDLEHDLPQVSEALSLAAQVMKDRKRRAIHMAEGGAVESNEDLPSGKRKSMDTYAMGGSVESYEDDTESSMVGADGGHTDEPTDSDMDNDADETGAPDTDPRENSRGLNISQTHAMLDEEHKDMVDTSDASLVGQIMAERKARRRNKY